VDASAASLLELGALDRPLAIGPQVRYADHLSTAGLIAKYGADPAVTKDSIVQVDYVLDGRRLSDIVGDQRFDGVVASHVIEHVPDVIGWLSELAEVLRPGGKVYLYIPDGRYCFDHRRPPTTPGQLLDATLARRKTPSPGAVLDALGLFHHADARQLWRDPAAPAGAAHAANTRVWDFVRSAEAGDYLDVHCHVFTPAAFLDSLRLLIEGDLIAFGVADFADTAVDELEFLVTLELSPLPPGPERRAALLATLPSLAAPPAADGELRARLFDALDRSRQACDIAEQRMAGALEKADHLREVNARIRLEVKDQEAALLVKEAGFVAREAALTAEIHRMRSHPAVRLMDRLSRLKRRFLPRAPSTG
jgi:SAM-dependent methyltransferase